MCVGGGGQCKSLHCFSSSYCYTMPSIKDIIMEVKLEKRDHQLHHLLCILHKTLLQLFGITHLEYHTHTHKLHQLLHRHFDVQPPFFIIRLFTSIWQAVAFSSSPAVLMPKLCWSPRLTNSHPSSSEMFSMSWAVRNTWMKPQQIHETRHKIEPTVMSS